MKIPKKLIFVRHPESEGNVLSADGRANHALANHRYPLTPRGKLQAASVSRYIKTHYNPGSIKRFYQSNYLRSQELVSQLLFVLEWCPDLVTTDSRLDEKWDGIFYDLQRQEIEIRYPDQIRIRERTGYYQYRAPGGQNCPDVEMQIRSLMDDCYEECRDETILFSGHGRWFLLFLKLLHHHPISWLEEMRKRDDVCPNASITIIERMDDGRIVEHPCVVPWRGQLGEEKTEFA